MQVDLVARGVTELDFSSHSERTATDKERAAVQIIETIDASRNEISVLRNITIFASLQTLILRHNALTSPVSFWAFELPKTLQVLDLAYNEITTLGGNGTGEHSNGPLASLPCLTELDLSHNLLDSNQMRLSAECEAVLPMSLTRLRLEHNSSLFTLNDITRGLRSLRHLSAIENRISSLEGLEQVVVHCPALETLNIQGNPLIESIGSNYAFHVMQQFPQVLFVDGERVRTRRQVQEHNASALAEPVHSAHELSPPRASVSTGRGDSPAGNASIHHQSSMMVAQEDDNDEEADRLLEDALAATQAPRVRVTESKRAPSQRQPAHQQQEPPQQRGPTRSASRSQNQQQRSQTRSPEGTASPTIATNDRRSLVSADYGCDEDEGEDYNYSASDRRQFNSGPRGTSTSARPSSATSRSRGATATTTRSASPDEWDSGSPGGDSFGSDEEDYTDGDEYTRTGSSAAGSPMSLGGSQRSDRQRVAERLLLSASVTVDPVDGHTRNPRNQRRLDYLVSHIEDLREKLAEASGRARTLRLSNQALEQQVSNKRKQISQQLKTLSHEKSRAEVLQLEAEKLASKARKRVFDISHASVTARRSREDRKSEAAAEAAARRRHIDANRSRSRGRILVSELPESTRQEDVIRLTNAYSKRKAVVDEKLRKQRETSPLRDVEGGPIEAERFRYDGGDASVHSSVTPSLYAQQHEPAQRSRRQSLGGSFSSGRPVDVSAAGRYVDPIGLDLSQENEYGEVRRSASATSRHSGDRSLNASVASTAKPRAAPLKASPKPKVRPQQSSRLQASQRSPSKGKAVPAGVIREVVDAPVFYAGSPEGRRGPGRRASDRQTAYVNQTNSALRPPHTNLSDRQRGQLSANEESYTTVRDVAARQAAQHEAALHARNAHRHPYDVSCDGSTPPHSANSSLTLSPERPRSAMSAEHRAQLEHLLQRQVSAGGSSTISGVGTRGCGGNASSSRSLSMPAAPRTPQQADILLGAAARMSRSMVSSPLRAKGINRSVGGRSNGTASADVSFGSSTAAAGASLDVSTEVMPARQRADIANDGPISMSRPSLK